MNTRTRRFVIRLIIGLLTFLIGVFAAMVLGNFSPLEGRHVRPRVRRCGDYARSASAPSIVVPVSLPYGALQPRYVTGVNSSGIEFKTTPHAPQSKAEPVVPSFEDEGEVKRPTPVVSSHQSH